MQCSALPKGILVSPQELLVSFVIFSLVTIFLMLNFFLKRLSIVLTNADGLMEVLGYSQLNTNINMYF